MPSRTIVPVAALSATLTLACFAARAHADDSDMHLSITPPLIPSFTRAKEVMANAQILRPPLLPDAQPIGNPMSGFYADNLLQSEFAAALSTQTSERYENIFWSCLENHGTFDFSIIDKVLASPPPFEPHALGTPRRDPRRRLRAGTRVRVRGRN
jgi:hypothetical protein